MSWSWFRRVLGPEILFVLAVTAWGSLFLPRFWADLLWAIDGTDPSDFSIFASAARLAWAGGDVFSAEACSGCGYRYSPLFAYMFAPIAALGPLAWLGLHLAAIVGLPWRIARILPFLWPFWWELGTGSNMIFVLLLAHHALLGRRWAIVATLVVALLIPRPLMIPIVALLLWDHRYAVFPFLGAAAGSVVFAHLTGHLGKWLEVMAGSGSEIAVSYNIGPSAVIGAVWLPIGFALAAWLTWQRRPGWASLCISPYWLPYYLLIGLLELVPRAARTQTDREDQGVLSAGAERLQPAD